MKNYTLVRTIVALVLLAALPLIAAGPKIDVFKTATCGCCGKWVEHLKTSGFDVAVHEVPGTADYRVKYGVPEKLQSCHTAVVNGYAIEGHVPAQDIHRLLKMAPHAKGLAVPGMPAGSPGMDSPHSPAYSVLLFDEKGGTTVFQKYPEK